MSPGSSGTTIAEAIRRGNAHEAAAAMHDRVALVSDVAVLRDRG